MTGGVLRRPRRGCRSEIRRSLTRRLLTRRCWSTRNTRASIFVVFRVTEWPRRLCLLAVAVWLGASGSAAAIGQPERAIRTAMQAYRAATSRPPPVRSRTQPICGRTTRGYCTTPAPPRTGTAT